MRNIALRLLSVSLSGAVVLASPITVYSESDESVFEPALVSQSPAAEYPLSQRMAQNSAMVGLRFMLNESGGVYEAIVIESTDSAFEESALQAIKSYRYKPAKLAGEPIQSVATAQIYYSAKDAKDKVHSDFAKVHRDVTRELAKQQPSAKRIAKKVEKLEEFNRFSPYTHTFLNLLKFRIAKAFGDIEGQIKSAQRVLLFDAESGARGPYVEEQVRIAMKRELFGAYVNSGRYAEALSIYQALQDIDPGAQTTFAATVDQLRAVKAAKNPVSVAMTVAPRGYESLTLFKNAFSIGNVEGRLVALNLRCERKFAALEFSLTTQYKVPEEWGQCYLQVVGDPASKFKLTQF